MLIGAYMDTYRCLKVLKVPTGAYRCLQVGTGGHRWQVLGDLPKFVYNYMFRRPLAVNRVPKIWVLGMLR